ncbi:MAG: hypothetical protein NTZ78_04445 [Candidatus Aureabacteria bacterium]|nr:hypothetical protein [Candidatus Auribacterota bacterium]
MNQQTDETTSQKKQNQKLFIRRRGRGWVFLAIYAVVATMPLWALGLSRLRAVPQDLPPAAADRQTFLLDFWRMMILPYLIIFLPFLVSALHHLMNPETKIWKWMESRVKRHVVWANVLFFMGGAAVGGFWMSFHGAPPESPTALIIPLLLLLGSAKLYVGKKV